MKTQAGVWIDHRRAILVLMTNAGPNVVTIESGIAEPIRSGAGNSYTSHDYVAEDRLERKTDSLLKQFYDDVIAGLQGSQSLLVLGPGEAKGEFVKHLKSRKLPALTVEIETADKMTDAQIAAQVSKYFGQAAVSNS